MHADPVGLFIHVEALFIFAGFVFDSVTSTFYILTGAFHRVAAVQAETKGQGQEQGED